MDRTFLARFKAITISFWVGLLGAVLGILLFLLLEQILISLLLEQSKPDSYDVIAALRGETVDGLHFVMNSDGCLSTIYSDPKPIDDPRKSLSIK